MPFTIRRWGTVILAALALAIAGQVPPVDRLATRKPDLVPLKALDPTIRVDLKYAGKDNFMGRAMYPAGAEALLNREAALALSRANAALKPKGYVLLVWDAYRPWSVTRDFWEATPPDKRKFVADPAKGSVHNRGCAADVTLFDLRSGAVVEMPSGFDEMTERAYPDYSGGSPTARRNRDLLRATMEAQGFSVYPTEWWHFDYKTWKQYPVMDAPFSSLTRVEPGRIPTAASPPQPSPTP
jgi:D-alanyl-D-alanine dipeptidase